MSGRQIQELLEEHLRSMHSISPPESVHALDLHALRAPQISFWTAWQGSELLGCGALKELDRRHGEIKSMRTAASHRRKGVARTMLEHIVAQAEERGYARLSLETGSQADFEPARRLYRSFGFVDGPPFADYAEDPNSVFLTKTLPRAAERRPRVQRSNEAPSMAEMKVSDNWAHGDAYERYVGRWSRRVAPMFLAWLEARPGAKWADIGCGTGALCAAILDQCQPSSVTGVEPSAGFLETAHENLAGRAALHQGSATAIPLADASVDFVVSALVLNFVPDQPAAVKEMARVASSGGTVAAYVWDYSGRMELMQHFWAAAESLDANVTPIAEKHRFPGCRPEPLRVLFSDGGLDGIDVKALEVAMPFASFDDYWQPFLGGQGPAPAYAMSLDETARSRLCEALRNRLPIQSDGSIPLAARAWAVRGTKARSS